MPDFSFHSCTVRIMGLVWGFKHHVAPTRAVPEPHAALLLVFAQVYGSSGELYFRSGLSAAPVQPWELAPRGTLAFIWTKCIFPKEAIKLLFDKSVFKIMLFPIIP